MSKRQGESSAEGPPVDPFDLAGSDPELLNSGRIPDPQPEHTPLFRWLAKVLTGVEARLRARGDRVLRGGIKAFWIALSLVGLFLLFGPIINKPLDFDDVIDSAELSEVDWVARDAAIDYTVDRAADGTFAAEVSERYTADFVNGPEGAIEREIVTEFRGHDVEFALLEATVDGVAAEVAIDDQPTTTTIRLTNPDGTDFEGAPEVHIAYELHHLIASATDEATDRPVDELSWPLFAPTWPQATKGIEVSLTLAPEVNDALIRAPKAYVGWLLISETVWLTPDAETADGVRYAFTNDDTLPPNADVWIDASFEPGTFELPPKTTLFWVQTYGPLVPLVLLGLLLLFALAARRIVWADSAGEPWYLPRSTPVDAAPELAARLLDRPRHGELIDALDGAPRTRTGDRDSRLGEPRLRWLETVARAGRRAGRAGNFPSVWRRRARWSSTDPVVDQKLRWVPDSYVRDTFVFAPVAITLLQWGILRQLSEQVLLSVVWWPVAFVAVSTALAVATLWAVQRPRPLTRNGALLMQQLRGIDAYARATRLRDRGPIDDPLLPYALLFERPRRAGKAATQLAAEEAGDPRLGRGWRTEHFVSIPSLVALAASIAIFAGAVVTAATLPTPYYSEYDHISRFGDLPGTTRTQVEGFEIDATLDRDAEGAARLRVTERNTVNFDAGGRVPQFAREWPSTRLGQPLGTAVDAVRIDGAEVPFREIPQSKSLAVVTQLEEVLTGKHQVEVEYSLSSPVVDAVADPESTQQLRWTALYSFWDDSYYTNASNPYDGSAPVRPIAIQLTIAPELVGAIEGGGWIESDMDRAKVQHESGNWYGPWQAETRTYSDAGQGYDLLVGSESTDADGALVVRIDVDGGESRASDIYGEGPPFAVNADTIAWLDKYDLGLSTDLGALINFAPGTFTGVDSEAFDRYRNAYHLPFGIVLGLAGLITLASLGTIIAAVRSRRGSNASLATVAFAAIPIAAVGQIVYFGWAVMSMTGSDARGGAAFALLGLMALAVTVQAVVVARKRAKPAATAARATSKSNSKSTSPAAQKSRAKPTSRSAQKPRNRRK